jgi:hypothetical protein
MYIIKDNVFIDNEIPKHKDVILPQIINKCNVIPVALSANSNTGTPIK